MAKKKKSKPKTICPICAVNVRVDRLESHIKRIHPNQMNILEHTNVLNDGTINNRGITMNSDGSISPETEQAFSLIEKVVREKMSMLEQTKIGELEEKQEKIKLLEESIGSFYKMGMAHLTTNLQHEKEALEKEVHEPLQTYEFLQYCMRKLNYLIRITQEKLSTSHNQ